MRKLLKLLLPLTLIFTLVLSSNTLAFASKPNSNTELQKAYERVISYANDNNIPLDMTFDIFVAGYNEQEYSNVKAYEQVYYSILQPRPQPQFKTKNTVSTYSSSSSGSGNTWYYNIGTSLPSTANPKYSTYKLLSTVQKGDIIFEANGGYGITGHIAVVEGIFYDAQKKINYVRIIEAIDCGVVRSCLDDTRVNDKEVSIYRVTRATATNKTNAVNFCIGELGSSYSLDFAKDTSSSETNWYCSELAWAAYKNQGIDIETTAFFNEPGITPRDIKRSSEVSSVSFK